MAIESQTYSGVCKYSDIDFTFVYIDNELRLIPPADKRAQIRKARIRKYTENGAYTTDKLLTMDEPVLTGHCYETGANIFFITKQGGYISSCDSVLFVPIVAYILCRYNLDTIARMSFSGPVIDCIYPVNQGIKFSMNAENFFETGVFTATTQSYGDTTTDPQSFTVDDKRLSVKFGISRGLSTKLNVSPITLSSSMYFEFEPTKDYRFIFRLWRIAKLFIQYLCYRKNISLSKVELSSIAEDGRYERFATLHVFDETGDDEPEILQSGRYIKQIFLAGAEGKILTDIADGTLYLRHLPQSYRNGRSIDASRFVMITAAFEWEFHRSFPVGITKSEATLNAEETVSRKIEQQISWFDELPSALVFNKPREETSDFICPKCNAISHQSKGFVDVTFTVDKKKIIISRKLELQDWLQIKWCVDNICTTEAQLYETITFNLRNGHTFVSLEDGHDKKIQIRDITNIKPNLYFDDPIFELIDLYKPVKRELRNRFIKIFRGSLPFRTKELTVEQFVLMTRFIGYNCGFYDALPYAEKENLIEISFLKSAKRLHHAVKVPNIFEKTTLPKVKSIRKLFFCNPALFFIQRNSNSFGKSSKMSICFGISSHLKTFFLSWRPYIKCRILSISMRNTRRK